MSDLDRLLEYRNTGQRNKFRILKAKLESQYEKGIIYDKLFPNGNHEEVDKSVGGLLEQIKELQDIRNDITKSYVELNGKYLNLAKMDCDFPMGKEFCKNHKESK